MKVTDLITPAPPGHPSAGRTAELALRLAAAENALLTLTTGQVDAVLDASGRTYLLRPAQEQLRERESRLRAVLRSITDVITVVDRAGVILSQNDAVTRVLGFQADELVNVVLFRLVHDEDLPDVHAAFVRIVEGHDDHVTARFRHRTGDGSFLLLEAALGTLRGAAPAGGVVFSMRPFTNPPVPVRLNRPIRQEAAVPAGLAPGGDGFSLPAYDVPPPRAAPRPRHGEGREDESAQEMPARLAAVRRNVETQLHLVEEFSASTAVGPYRVRLRLAAIDDPGTIRLVLAIRRREVTSTQIEVQLDLPAGEGMNGVNALDLQQIIWNLIRNAIRFSTWYRRAHDTDEEDDDAGRLVPEYAEYGAHIEPELLPLIYHSLPHDQEAVRSIYGSLRLGLFIAKGLAEARQGTLTVVALAPGQGTTFRLSFKITPPSPA